MTIGTDVLLATQTFTGTDGDPPPAGWTARQGTWQIVGNALGIVLGEGLPLHTIFNSPTRANDNYSVNFKFVSDIANGTMKGIMVRRTNGTTNTNNCYLIGCDDSSHAFIWKLANDVETALIDGGFMSGGWLLGNLTASVETVGGNAVLTLASDVNGTVVTVTDSTSPLLSGDIGLLTNTNGSQMAYDNVGVVGTSLADTLMGQILT